MSRLFVFIVIALILLVILYIIYRRNFKILKVPSVCLVTGGVKTGKSLLSVNLSDKDYFSRHCAWWFATHILHKDIEEPLYYTNAQHSFRNINGKRPHKLDKNIRYISLEHLNRDIRFNYKSVIYIQECSLMADNMDVKNKIRNVDLSLFNKLIGHETRGGVIYYDTQSPLDSHYSIKRVCSTYFFIQKSLNFILFRVLYVREMVNTENGVNNFTDDVDCTTRKVLVTRRFYKHYNCYEYSYLTDSLPTANKPVPVHNGVVSFNDLYVSRSDKRVKGVQK